MSYTSAEWRTIEPLARSAEVQALSHPERRDLLLCHAWDDRNGAAREFCDLLVSLGATVWFSENEVGLGKSLLREIDRGLATSRIGIVLVTPALLESLAAQGVADQQQRHRTSPCGDRPATPGPAQHGPLDGHGHSTHDVAACSSSARRVGTAKKRRSRTRRAVATCSRVTRSTLSTGVVNDV